MQSRKVKRMNAQTVTNAVNNLNKASQSQLEAKVGNIIAGIRLEQASIRCRNEDNTTLQLDLSKIVDATPEIILGKTVDATKPFGKLVADVIGKVQTEQQEGPAFRLARAIAANNSANEAANKRIAEMREAINKLEAEVVTVASVTGATA